MKSGLCLLVALLASGCVSAADSSPQGGALPSGSPSVHVSFINVSIRGSSVAWDGEPNGGNVDFAANLTQAVAEARWTCPAGPCELKLIMINPDQTGGASAVGSGSARTQVDAPAAGRWNVQLRPTSVVDAVGEIRVSVFGGAIMPPGYSAFS